MVDISEYTDSELLKMAFNMLTLAREEQIKDKRKKDKWLMDNTTYKVIRDRVEEIKNN